jgi:PAS domain S-box-containing protein
VIKRTVVIVGGASDTGEFRELEGRVARLGYDVAAIVSSEGEALDVASQSHPDVVLMDIARGGDAHALGAAEERRRGRRIPVVFMIVAEDETELRRTAGTEPCTYVVKPFSERELGVNIELALLKRDAARAVREQLDNFFAVSVDMFCFLDFNGHFKRLNPAWEQTLGFTREELMSRPFIEFVHPDDRERTLAQNAKVRAGGRAASFENRYLCKDGSYRWFRWNAAPDSSEKVIYSVARDITESKRAEDERELLLRQLQAAAAEVKSLRSILPMCSYCRKIRDDENNWQTVECYINDHTTTKFSHGICPSCMENVVEPQIEEMERE